MIVRGLFARRRMPTVEYRPSGEVEYFTLRGSSLEERYFSSLNAPMSGAGVRSAEASAPLAG